MAATANELRDKAIARAVAALAEDAAEAAADPLRPACHFLPPTHWMNDPNGPIYHNGFYHVFYQHNPYVADWGQMHWGHARSRDLLRWEHLPPAVWPSKELGEEQCWSGCSAITPDGQPLLFYTSIGPKHEAYDAAEQWAAIGDDELITWTKHPANPVLSETLHGDQKIYHWRDPFVFEAAGRTFMVLGGKLDESEGGQAVIALYETENAQLSSWRYRGILYRHPDRELASLECPNFFPLGDKFVLLYSPYKPIEYHVGEFDPEAGTFTPETSGILDGGGYYASTPLANAPGPDIMFGWIRGYKQGRGWCGCLGFPRELFLRPDGRLGQRPVAVLEDLRGEPLAMPPTRLTESFHVLPNVSGDCLEVRAKLSLESASCFELRFGGADGVVVSCEADCLRVGNAAHPIEPLPADEPRVLRVFFDRSLVEVFHNDCDCIAQVVQPEAEDHRVALRAVGGEASLHALDAWRLDSIW